VYNKTIVVTTGNIYPKSKFGTRHEDVISLHHKIDAKEKKVIIYA
jgi:hypothetical protein